MKQSVMLEVDVATAVAIGLVATDVAGLLRGGRGLLQGEVIVINIAIVRDMKGEGRKKNYALLLHIFLVKMSQTVIKPVMCVVEQGITKKYVLT